MAKLNEGISQIKKGSALETMYNRLLTGMEQASHETLPDFTGSDYVDGYVAVSYTHLTLPTILLV